MLAIIRTSVQTVLFTGTLLAVSSAAETLDLAVHSQNRIAETERSAVLVNGAVVEAAAAALAALTPTGPPAAEADEMVVASDGRRIRFALRGATEPQRVVQSNMVGRNFVPVTGRTISSSEHPVAQLSVGQVRAAIAADAFLKEQDLPASVTERNLADYDVLIFERPDGYHVEFTHHHKGLVTSNGCEDGSGGYGGGYLVRPQTFLVTVEPGRCGGD